MLLSHDLNDVTQDVATSPSTQVSFDIVVLAMSGVVIAQKFAPLFTTAFDVDIAIELDVAPLSATLVKDVVDLVSNLSSHLENNFLKECNIFSKQHE